MRTLIVGFLFIINATMAQAAIDPDRLHDLAYQGDIAGVDAAMAEAHQQSLTGEITYDDLRDLVGVRTRTHPDMDDFRAQWIEALPASPYAQMTTAWSLYNDSIAIRGTYSARDTPEQATNVFR